MALLFLKRPSGSFNYVGNFRILSKKMHYEKCYMILGIDETSDQLKIRDAYLKLVKRYHPDSGTDEADSTKFQDIDKAFRILMNKKSKERWDVEEGVIVNHPDIKHTAPQHRQYLSYNGIGFGNPFQRQKQFANVRTMQGANNVLEHRISKTTAGEKALIDNNIQLKHKIKTKYGFDRLVEDLIQESISKGEFSNLKNFGKPLPSYQNHNPYVDFVTHKINEVLIKNGFTPEWIKLQKCIREESKQLKNNLLMERKYFGPYPLTVEENIDWSERVHEYKNIVESINKKINRFNLVVPVLNKQMLYLSLENEAQKVVVNGKSSKDVLNFVDPLKKENITHSNSEKITLMRILDYFFRVK